MQRESNGDELVISRKPLQAQFVKFFTSKEIRPASRTFGDRNGSAPFGFSPSDARRKIRRPSSAKYRPERPHLAAMRPFFDNPYAARAPLQNCRQPTRDLSRVRRGSRRGAVMRADHPARASVSGLGKKKSDARLEQWAHQARCATGASAPDAGAARTGLRPMTTVERPAVGRIRSSTRKTGVSAL